MRLPKQGRNPHHWTEAGAFHRNESGGRSSMSAGHRQRARMINDLPGKGTSRPQTSCLRTRTGASVQPTILVHGRIRHAKDPLVHVRTRHASKGLWVVNQLVGYPGRPRGGLIIVPSRHPFQQVPTPPPLWGGRGLCKSNAPAPSEYPLPLGHSVEKRNMCVL